MGLRGSASGFDDPLTKTEPGDSVIAGHTLFRRTGKTLSKKIDLPFTSPVPGDANEELEKFLNGASDDYGDYTFALLYGGDFRCREERLICAADQILLCTYSSGLFCYFELQAKHASSGYEAFTEIGLPEIAEVVAKCLKFLSLNTDATTSEIARATAEIPEDEFCRFLDDVDPLEALIYDNAHRIDEAISSYIFNNADTLRRG